MRIFGTVQAVRLNNDTGFVEAQVQTDLSKIDWYALSTSKNIQWRPSIGDKVQVLFDDRGEGVVIGGYVTTLVQEGNVDITSPNIIGSTTGSITIPAGAITLPTKTLKINGQVFEFLVK